jgi:hypothetical protein
LTPGSGVVGVAGRFFAWVGLAPGFGARFVRFSTAAVFFASSSRSMRR